MTKPSGDAALPDDVVDALMDAIQHAPNVIPGRQQWDRNIFRAGMAHAAARADALHAALRDRAIGTTRNGDKVCDVCGMRGPQERHAPNCLAAPKEGS
jgi:hypothetical protein